MDKGNQKFGFGMIAGLIVGMILYRVIFGR